MCLPLGDKIAECQQTVRKMDGFHHHIIRGGGDLIIGKIPDSANTGAGKTVSHLLRGTDGHGEHTHADRILLQKTLQLVCVVDGNTGNAGAHNTLTHIKSSQNPKSVTGETEIFNVAVSPEFRRKGIGKALIEKFIKTVREKDTQVIFLEVRTSTLSAISLYEKTGFVFCGIRKDYYTDPKENAILMRLAFDGTQEFEDWDDEE